MLQTLMTSKYPEELIFVSESKEDYIRCQVERKQVQFCFLLVEKVCS